MNYYLTAASLRLASANAVTRSAYRALSQGRTRARDVWHDREQWLIDRLPAAPGRLLELGTGWVHAYSLYPVLLRDDEVHCFDVTDRRNFASFRATLPVVLEQVAGMDLPPATLERARERVRRMLACDSFEAVYATLPLRCSISADGVPHYPAGHFDAVFSIDVLEHVETRLFDEAAAGWHSILKPGGSFLAQVGLNDHHSVYDGNRHPKRYLTHSHRMWDWLLDNEVQYCNRMTAGAIVGALERAGFAMESVDTEHCDLSRTQVHRDYQWQSDDDLRAVRLNIVARKL